MSQRVQSYETGELVVTFDPEKCQHTGICLRGLGAVFDIKRTRWIDGNHGHGDGPDRPVPVRGVAVHPEGVT